MKKLQYLAKTALSVMAISGMLFLSSCKDECKDVNCANGGTCVEGTCDCATGYEGTECQTEVRAKFISSYSINGSSACPDENDEITWSNVPGTISASTSGVTKVVINIASAITLTGTVNGSNVTIDPSSQNGLDYSGSGSVSGNTLNLTINEDLDGDVCIYTLTGTKQ